MTATTVTEVLGAIRDAIPDWAKDLRINLGNVLTSPHLSEQQIWGTSVASAIATRNKRLREAVVAEAARHLSEPALAAARTAAALMGMNNIYYRFTHLVGDEEYRRLPARLRMQAIANPGVDRVDFELWSLAVSAINGCGMCMEAHEHHLTEGGLKREAVQDAVRLAAVLNGVAVALEGATPAD